MNTCLTCRNRGICTVYRSLEAVLGDSDYSRTTGRFHKVTRGLKSPILLFDNETEIYKALAKTCKRYQEITL